MSGKVTALLMAGVACVSLAGCVAAPERTSGRVVVKDENTRIEVVFNERDRKLVHDWYHNRHKERKEYEEKHKHKDKKDKKNGLPPGLAKREELPPGLQKQVKKNGKLPPGLEGRRLPEELERQLSPLPKGYMRIEVGTDLVILDSDTRVTVDVIKDLPL